MRYMEIKESLSVNGIEYRLIRLLGKGKGGYSYLAERDGQQYVLKQIHHEPCSYYTFGNKIEAEQNDYHRLLATGIRIPKMIDIDIENERIIKELTGVSNRFAKFVTAMYYYDGTNLISSIGELCGEITTEPRGTKSFGYSSIFEIPEYKMTLAEIDDELRYAINHRGNASRLLIKQLKDYIVKK